MILTIIVFFLILQLLVFVHEWGHFITARRSGIAVEEFGFGLPPRIVGITRKDVLYSINALPFGGFVRLKGEDQENKDADSFSKQRWMNRLAVLSAGVLMNFLLAVVCYAVLFITGFPMSADRAQTADDTGFVSSRYLVVTGIVDGSPAEDGDIKVGDKIMTVNGLPIESLKKAQDSIHASEEVTLFLERKKEQKSVVLNPAILPDFQADGPIIGVGLDEIAVIRTNPIIALAFGFREVVSVSGRILSALGDIVRDLVVRRTLSPDVGGPVAIAVFTGRVIDLGWSHVLQFIAVISLNFSIINFLPLPALDGGRVLFLIIERIRGKPVGQRFEGLTHQIGFFVLIALAFLITTRDIARFELLGWLKRLF